MTHIKKTVIFFNDDLEKIDYLKERLGLRSMSAVIRYCINKTYNELKNQ